MDHMTIEISKEALVSVGEIPSYVPRNARTRKKINLATPWRWIQRGCRGVKLETVLIGGKRYTSVEALQRFVERTTAAADGTSTVTASTPSARKKAHEKANRELDAAGI